MTAERFSLDTGVLLHAADRDGGERHVRALEIVERAPRRPCTLTVQVLIEFFLATTGKGIVPRAEAASQVGDWLDLFPTVAVGSDALRAAVAAVEDRGLPFWGGLLLATAATAGCRTVLSEDIDDGARLGNVVVRDPFKGPGFSPEIAALLGIG